MKSVGGVAVCLPHGQVFQVPVWVILNYEPNLVPAGHQVSIYYQNLSAGIPIWQMMQSSVIGPGLVETKTLHFSTFAVFSQAGMGVDSGEIGERAPSLIPSRPPLPATTTPPPEQGSNKKLMIALVVAFCSLVTFASVFIVLVYRCRRQREVEPKAQLPFSSSSDSATSLGISKVEPVTTLVFINVDAAAGATTATDFPMPLQFRPAPLPPVPRSCLAAAQNQANASGMTQEQEPQLKPAIPAIPSVMQRLEMRLDELQRLVVEKRQRIAQEFMSKDACNTGNTNVGNHTDAQSQIPVPPLPDSLPARDTTIQVSPPSPTIQVAGHT
jgi:hypothetical protein